MLLEELLRLMEDKEEKKGDKPSAPDVGPAWWILKPGDDQAGPYKTHKAAEADLAEDQGKIVYGIKKGSTGKIKRVAPPAK